VRGSSSLLRVESQGLSLQRASSIRSTVTVDRRWLVKPDVIVSTVALSGVLASILRPDVIVETTRKVGGLILTARSSDCLSEWVSVWMLDYGTFTEVSVSLNSHKKLLRLGGGKRRVEGFCEELENALGL
jgi:hypothetical protein